MLSSPRHSQCGICLVLSNKLSKEGDILEGAGLVLFCSFNNQNYQKNLI
jgi:hypothetical protein